MTELSARSGIMTKLARRVRGGDRGYALAAVLGLGVMMLALVAVALTATSSGNQKAHQDEDWNAALAAAYAGLDDYQARLANDTRYARYGNADAAFSTGATLTLPDGELYNPAFEISTGGAWAQVPGSAGAASFRYEIDNGDFYRSGVLSIRSTGRVGTATRSVIADMRQTGFFDYVYFTNIEAQDPEISGDSADCANYVWLRPSGCTQIQFGTGDHLRGDVHSNDRLLVCGARFRDAVTSAARGASWTQATGAGCGNYNFESGLPTSTSLKRIPDTNLSMQLETRLDQGDAVPDPGCQYTGPTTIRFDGLGRMRVYSPWTKVTQESADPAIANANPTKCGVPGTASGQLGHTNGALIPVLDNNLIYVQKVDTSVATDPNYWAPGTTPPSFSCTGTGASGGWTFGSLRYPIRDSSNRDEGRPFTSTTRNVAYDCREGDVYVQGSVDGRMTISAGRYVYVTGDIRYTPARGSANNDVLGLVAQRAIWVHNPMRNVVDYSGLNNDSGTAMYTAGRTIDAALLSVSGTFQVQNYHVGGDRGTLRVYGSIAQNYRGTVARGSNGFEKDYEYDENLRNVAPPKFLAPATVSFGLSQVAGVPAAYDADGAPVAP